VLIDDWAGTYIIIYLYIVFVFLAFAHHSGALGAGGAAVGPTLM